MSRCMTVPKLKAFKGSTHRIVMVTAYDATFARLIDLRSVDAVLVGDSLGNVIQGHETTLPVSLDDVVYHCRCVSRGLSGPLLVGDLPFMTYQISAEQALASAARLMQDGRASAVKLEGGERVSGTVRRLVEAGIPVMGHIGLTPQSVHEFGGMKIQGRSPDGAQALLNDARALEQAGVFSLVLEGIPRALSAEITRTVSVPTIGISAGPGCDGQVLVLYDLLGMDETFQPKFLKRYAHLAETIRSALDCYANEVQQGVFPSDEHSFD